VKVCITCRHSCVNNTMHEVCARDCQEGHDGSLSGWEPIEAPNGAATVDDAKDAEIAALKAEVERLKLSEARVKELEHERNKAMGERNRALTREKEANEGWSQAQARVKELEASEKQHDADTDLPIPEGNCLACKGTGMRGPDWICGACEGSGIVRPSDD